MQLPGTREITQFLIGLMLLFGGVTLIPKAIIMYTRKNASRGVVYTCLGALSFFLSLIAFLMAFDKI